MVLAFVVLVFVAGMLLDTAAVLRLVFGWAARVWGRAPLEITVAAMLIVFAWVVFARQGTEATKPRKRRPAAKGRNGTQRSNTRRSPARAGKEGSPEKPEHAEPEAEPVVTVTQRKRGTRRKRVAAGENALNG